MEPLPGVYFVTAEASIEGLGRRVAVKAYHPGSPASWPLYDSRKFLGR